MRRTAILCVCAGLCAAVSCGPTVATSDSASSSGADDTAATTTTGDSDPPAPSSGPAATTSTSTSTTTSPASSDVATGVSGTTSEAGSESGSTGTTGGPSASGPSRLFIVYTGHGFYRDEAWTGTGTNFVLGPTLEALEPWREDLLIVEGIQNAPVPADLFGDAHNKAAPSLLTGGLIGSPSQGSEPGVNPHYAGGPSLDVVLGEILSAGAPVASIHLGVLATPPVSLPWLVSHRGLDELNLPYDDPGEAFDTLFAGVAPDPFLDQLSGSLVGFDATDPPATTEKQLELAAAAFTYDVTRVQLLSIDRAVPYIRWDALGYTDTMHAEMVQWPGPGDGGRSAYTYWAERLAGFLATLDATPDSNGGTLLEDTVVVWLSDMGSIPAAHTYNSIQVVIIDGSHTLATGQAIEVEATQADLSYTIAAALGVELEDFGAPSLDPAPIAELLAR